MLSNPVTFTPLGHLKAPSLSIEPTDDRQVRFVATTSTGEVAYSTVHANIADALQQVVNRMRLDGARQYEVSAG